MNAVLEGGHAVYWLRNGAPDKEEWKLGDRTDTIHADAKKAPISRGRCMNPKLIQALSGRRAYFFFFAAAFFSVSQPSLLRSSSIDSP